MDFMFQLAPEEYKFLRFQFRILKKGQPSKYLPYAFTKQGVAMQHILALDDAKLAAMIWLKMEKIWRKTWTKRVRDFTREAFYSAVLFILFLILFRIFILAGTVEPLTAARA